MLDYTLNMLVLASASPRRRELLTNAGIPFEVRTANINEECHPGESGEALARRLAEEKARAVAGQCRGRFILGADTVVLAGAHGEGEVLGKPIDAADAARMLRLLSGREHHVITAICLLSPDGSADVRHESTRVFMYELGGIEIRDYIATREPMDKAGAYAIQGRASRWIHRIEGDYFNVVGLPVALVSQMLREAGVLPPVEG